MRKLVLLILITIPLFIITLFSNVKQTKAQGYVQCAISLGCATTLQCASGYYPPARCNFNEADRSDCCYILQGDSCNINQFPCTAAQDCPTSDTHTCALSQSCNSDGDYFFNCNLSGGGVGNCCAYTNPWTPTPVPPTATPVPIATPTVPPCEPTYECRTYAMAGCLVYGLYDARGTCPSGEMCCTPAGVPTPTPYNACTAANGCEDQSDCTVGGQICCTTVASPPPYCNGVCTYPIYCLGGETTPTPTPSDTRTCTAGLPSDNCYPCYWGGLAYGCLPGTDYARSETNWCSSSFTWQPELCAQFTDADSCTGDNPSLGFECVLARDDYVGFRCTGPAGGDVCYGCTQDDVDNGQPGCDPPVYTPANSGGTLEAAAQRCLDVCIGSTERLFACVDYQCVESATGVPFGECSLTCRTRLDPTCDGGNGINTAIGCIPVNDPRELIRFILQWGMGIAGGIALLLIVYAGFLITTSSGIPQRLQAGKELLTAAIAGLILLLFSVYILQFVGLELFGIPSFQ